MRNAQIPVIVLIALCAGFLLYVNSSVGHLPDRMATHFGFHGDADGWMTRSGYAIFVSCVGVGLPLLFVALGYLCRLFPTVAINIPNRQYWLAPERRQETLDFVLVAQLWMACIMVLFLGGIHYLTIQANTLTPPRLPMDQFWPFIGCFLTAVAVWMVLFMSRFRRPA